MLFTDAPTVQLYIGMVIATLDWVLIAYLKPYDDSYLHKEEILQGWATMILMATCMIFVYPTASNELRN